MWVETKYDKHRHPVGVRCGMLKLFGIEFIHIFTFLIFRQPDPRLSENKNNENVTVRTDACFYYSTNYIDVHSNTSYL